MNSATSNLKHNYLYTLLLYLSANVVELESENKERITMMGARLRIEEPSRWWKATKSDQDGIGGGNFFKILLQATMTINY